MASSSAHEVLNSCRGLKTMLGRWGANSEEKQGTGSWSAIPHSWTECDGPGFTGDMGTGEGNSRFRRSNEYARLIRASDLAENKLVSLSALFDPTFYTPI